jgi:hypothetical protein
LIKIEVTGSIELDGKLNLENLKSNIRNHISDVTVNEVTSFPLKVTYNETNHVYYIGKDGTINEEEIDEIEGFEKVYSKDSLELGTSEYLSANSEKYADFNTGIKLFDSENRNKDFEISLDIGEIKNWSKQATLCNTKLESSPYPGFVFRFQSLDNGKIEFGCNQIAKKEFKVADVQTFKIKRENNNIYYKVNDGEYIVYTEASNIPEIDTTVSFGCSIDANGNIDRIFEGVLSNISIKLDNEIVYECAENEFNTYGYAVTDIKLFDDENWGKDFIISFNIDKYGNNENFATICNALREVSPDYPGIVLRCQNNKLHLEGHNTAKIFEEFNFLDVNQVTLKRVNNILYYSFNNSDTFNELLDCSTTPKHNIPLSFGCIVKDNGKRERIFNGKISKVKVYLKE